MIDFLKSEECLSVQVSKYFGQKTKRNAVPAVRVHSIITLMLLLSRKCARMVNLLMIFGLILTAILMSSRNNTRIVYMGTPEFAVPPLEALVEGIFNSSGYHSSG